MRRLSTTVGAALLLLLAACSGSAGTPAGGDPTTLAVAVARMNASLDPAEASTTSYLRAYGAGESLSRIQADGSVAPELAERVQRTGPSTWTATLRAGSRFQKGAPVTADAVRASLERSRAGNEFAADLLDGVRVSVQDPRTVRFDTAGPSPFLDYTLSHYELQIHNVASYAGLTGPAGPGNADLTGPFRVTGFGADRNLDLERNPSWWGPAPSVQRVQVQRVADGQARTQVALAGQADVVDLLPGDAVARLRDADGVRLEGAPAANTVTVYLNPSSPAAPALADQRVRQALAWAVNREEAAEVAGEGLTTPAPSWLSSNPAYPQADQQGYPRFDPARAARMLDEAGWVAGPDGMRAKGGQPLRFRLQTWGTEQATGEALQAQWSAIGVGVDLSYVDSTLVNQARQRGDWDAQTAAFTTLGDVPSLFDTQMGPDGSGNYGRFRIPRSAELVARANAGRTEQERTAAILALNELMSTVVPSIPVHPRPQITAVSARLSGFVPHPLQYENLVRPDYVLAPAP